MTDSGRMRFWRSLPQYLLESDTNTGRNMCAQSASDLNFIAQKWKQ